MSSDLNQKNIAFLCDNDYLYPVVQLAIWKAGGVTVPLCTLLCLSNLKQNRAVLMS